MTDDPEKPAGAAQPDPGAAERKTIFEEIEVAGSDLIDKVKSLIREGNVRRLKLSAPGGDFSLELPVTVGVIAGGALALAAPWLAILGGIAALVTKVRIEVERDPTLPSAPPEEPKPPES